jgi:hypothetical protein
MKATGKLDYIEFAATGGTLDSVKSFYASAFGWSFTDYGPTYAAFDEGLDGGFQADATEAADKPLPILYSDNLEETLARRSECRSIPFPADGAFISSILPATSWLSGAIRNRARIGSYSTPTLPAICSVSDDCTFAILSL